MVNIDIDDTAARYLGHRLNKTHSVIQEIRVNQVDENNLDEDTLQLGGDLIANSYNDFLINRSLQLDQYVIPDEIEHRIVSVLEALKYENNTAATIARELVKELLIQNYLDFQISHTGEGELLIYTKDSESFKNIVIDEEGDIELISLPTDRRKAWNMIYFNDEELNLSQVISTFNGMR